MANQQTDTSTAITGFLIMVFIFFGIPLIITFLLPVPRMVIAKLRNPSAPMETHPMFKEPRPLTAKDREDMYWESVRESRMSRFER